MAEGKGNGLLLLGLAAAAALYYSSSSTAYAAEPPPAPGAPPPPPPAPGAPPPPRPAPGPAVDPVVYEPVAGTYTPPGGTPQPIAPGEVAGASGAGPLSPNPYPRLGAGQTRQTVEYAQRVLRALGYTVAIDGAWGPQTSRAIRAFQVAAARERGWRLVADGVLGGDTWAALRWYASVRDGGRPSDEPYYYNADRPEHADTLWMTVRAMPGRIGL